MTSSWSRISLRSLNALLAALSLAVLFNSTGAIAQDCQDTPEGRICKNKQAITAGAIVDANMQKKMGLVTINGGCSGTLLNQYWVLTARHCVTQGPATRSPISFPGSMRTVDDGMSNPLLAPGSVTVTADWAPGRTGTATSIYDFQANTNAFAANVNATRPTISDIVLINLGDSNLGPVDSQKIYAIRLDMGGGSIKLSGRVRTTDTVTQYGRGFGSLASGTFGTPSARPGTGLGTFRSASFTPSNISERFYDLAMNSSNQVGHGGDSGGPTVVTVNGVGVGIAGVQTTCRVQPTTQYPTGYMTNAPTPAGATSPNWDMATGIALCTYVATEPFMTEILRETKKRPAPPDRSEEIADRDPRGKNAEQCAASHTRNEARCMNQYGPGSVGQISCSVESQQIWASCQSLAAKDAAEIAADRDPRGKNANECAAARARNETRCLRYGGPGSPGNVACTVEVQQIWGSCQSLAAQAAATENAAIADDRNPTGKTAEQCAAARARNEARCMNQYGPGSVGQVSCNVEITQLWASCQSLAAQAAANGNAPAPAAPADAPPAGGAGKPAHTILAVEVYDAANGTGKVIGELGADTELTIVADLGNDWFEVTGENVPTGHGFVYSGDSYRSLEED